MSMKTIVIPGSNRSGSFNGRLADCAALELARQGAEVTRISLVDYPLPILDEDLMNEKGIPEPALKLARLIARHDGVFLCCPEYNSSITPLLKNMIDWTSLVSSDQGRAFRAWEGRYVALGSASNGQLAGIRGLYHVRSILMNVGAQVVSQQCSVSQASTAFNADGTLKNDQAAEKMVAACTALIDHCRLITLR